MLPKKKLSKINTITGKISWTYLLDEKTTSKSSIFVKDSLLYMINQGYANFGNRKINFGDPFILSLNAETGKQEYTRTIGTKDDFILDFKMVNDDILLVLKDRILRLSLSNNNKFEEKTVDPTAFGELKYFAGSRTIFKREDSILSNLVASDSTKYFVQTDTGITLELDYEFQVSNQYNKNDLYFYYNDLKDYKFFLKGDRSQTIISDKDNHIIAEINTPGFFFIFGDNLYAIEGKSLYIIDVNDLYVL